MGCLRLRWPAPLLLMLVLLAHAAVAQQQQQQLEEDGGPSDSDAVEDGSACPVSAQQMAAYAPEAAVAAVRDACASPLDDDFCVGCICTMQAHFIPSTLAAAGALPAGASTAAQQQLVDACSLNSDMALVALRALGSDSAAAIITQCDDATRQSLGAPGACKQYAPKALPQPRTEPGGGKQPPQPRQQPKQREQPKQPNQSKQEQPKQEQPPPDAKQPAAPAGKCPFSAGDIEAEELLFVKQACNASTASKEFCLACHCGMQSTVAAIAGRRKALFAPGRRSGSNSNNGSSGGGGAAPGSAPDLQGERRVAMDCSREVMAAMLEGGVFGQETLATLTGDTCRWFVRMSPQEQRDTCHGNLEATPAGPKKQQASGAGARVRAGSALAAAAAALGAAMVLLA